MWKSIKDFNAKDEKPMIDGRKMWVAASRTPEDRKKGKTLATYKKEVMVDVGLAKADSIDFDSRRGILWVGTLSR